MKVFTAWDEHKYYTGLAGDYIVMREDDEHDIYIVRGDIFKKTYGNRVVTELFRDVVQEGWGTAVGI